MSRSEKAMITIPEVTEEQPCERTCMITWPDDTREPVFKFTGNWTMLHVNAISTLAAKNWRAYMMSLRQEAPTKEIGDEDHDAA